VDISLSFCVKIVTLPHWKKNWRLRVRYNERSFRVLMQVHDAEAVCICEGKMLCGELRQPDVSRSASCRPSLSERSQGTSEHAILVSFRHIVVFVATATVFGFERRPKMTTYVLGGTSNLSRWVRVECVTCSVVVLFLKESLRTKFKSLSWSLTVKSWSWSLHESPC